MADKREGGATNGSAMERRNRRRRLAITAQGLYYILTGLWPLAHFSSFSRAVALPVNPYQAQVFGAILVVLGAHFIETGRRDAPGSSTTLLGIAIAGAIAVVDMVWLPRLGTVSALWIDLVVEVAIAAALVVFYPRLQTERNPLARRR